MNLPWWHSGSRFRPLVLAVPLAIVLALLVFHSQLPRIQLWRLRDGTICPSPRHSTLDRPDFCHAFNVSNLAISVKTGATESRQKVATQLMTILRCVEDVMIFSDLEGNLGAHEIDNALSDQTRKSSRLTPDFDIYWKQRDYLETGRETELESLGDLPVPYNDWRSAGKTAAWALDKHKFLPMIKHAWDKQPDKDWYIFIEDDTYLSVGDLVRFLATQDPSEKLYLGKPLRMWEHPTPLSFAHGGSGFILSKATMQAFADAYYLIEANFQPLRVTESHYGDFVVADALDEVLHVLITDATPMISSDPPALLPFGEDTWCKPVITMHHMDPRRFDDMYKFQKARNFPALLFRDVYAVNFKAGMPGFKESWDNLSDNRRHALNVTSNEPARMENTPERDGLLDPHSSSEACSIACAQNEDCFQYMYLVRMLKDQNETLVATPECHLSRAFRFGKGFVHEEHEPGEDRTSGWQTERIERWIQENQECSSTEPGQA